jgi:ERF superfamily protein
VNHSESITKISSALSIAWENIGSAKKDGTNPHYRSSYSTLSEVIEVVKKPLLDQGIAVLQPTVSEGDKEYVETILLHVSGEWISGRTLIVCAKPHDPQAQGSAITYAKRYGLQAMCCVPSEDDDGEGAMDRQKKVKDPNAELQALGSKKQYDW